MPVRTVFSAPILGREQTEPIHTRLSNWADGQDQNCWISHGFYLTCWGDHNYIFHLEIISHQELSRDQKITVFDLFKESGLRGSSMFVDPNPAI